METSYLRYYDKIHICHVFLPTVLHGLSGPAQLFNKSSGHLRAMDGGPLLSATLRNVLCVGSSCFLCCLLPFISVSNSIPGKSEERLACEGTNQAPASPLTRTLPRNDSFPGEAHSGMLIHQPCLFCSTPVLCEELLGCTRPSVLKALSTEHNSFSGKCFLLIYYGVGVVVTCIHGAHILFTALLW